jgi:hypothetical protein
MWRAPWAASLTSSSRLLERPLSITLTVLPLPLWTSALMLYLTIFRFAHQADCTQTDLPCVEI